MNKFKKAFTLIELLVVIAIIAILATLAVVALQNSRASARDAKRLADVKQMQTALELYFNDNSSYPTSVTSTIATSGIVYMTTVPTPPTPVDGDCTAENNNYTYSSDGSTYSINFCLGKQTAGLSSGAKVLTRDGVSNSTSGGGSESFACGDTFTDPRDSQQYPTVQIGTQCWMVKNLAYLPSVQDNATFVSFGNSSQPAYGVYGYNGSDVNTAKGLDNYTTYGVLYNWYAAMNNSETPSAQGVCPAGWHVPSLDQYNTLYDYVNSQTQYKCDSTDGYIGKAIASNSGWGSDTTVCAPANNQQTNNSTGFNALPAGARGDNGSFSQMGYQLIFWSSSLFDSDNAYLYSLWYSNPNFYSSYNPFLIGSSVRCLKD